MTACGRLFRGIPERLAMSAPLVYHKTRFETNSIDGPLVIDLWSGEKGVAMGKLRLFIAIIVAAMALALIPAVVSAQGATTFYGNVTIDGQRAPSGTTVVVTQADGTELGRGTTGEGSFAADQYRIEIQATPGLDGQTVNMGVPETSQAIQATAVFERNRAT